MSGQVRELLRKVEAIGWHFLEYDGNDHIRLRNDDGQVASIPNTPSDSRSMKNTLAQLERMTGRKLPRVNHRRSRKNFTRDEDAEVEASRRRHEQTWQEKAAERDRLKAAENARRRAAQQAAGDDRRRREIEELMR